jgi:hypothetical protein
MKNTAANRIAAALMSVVVTLVSLNALALYGNPRRAGTEASLAKNTTPAVIAMSGNTGATRSYH